MTLTIKRCIADIIDELEPVKRRIDSGFAGKEGAVYRYRLGLEMSIEFVMSELMRTKATVDFYELRLSEAKLKLQEFFIKQFVRLATQIGRCEDFDLNISWLITNDVAEGKPIIVVNPKDFFEFRIDFEEFKANNFGSDRWGYIFESQLRKKQR